MLELLASETQIDDLCLILALVDRRRQVLAVLLLLVRDQLLLL